MGLAFGQLTSQVLEGLGAWNIFISLWGGSRHMGIFPGVTSFSNKCVLFFLSQLVSGFAAGHWVERAPFSVAILV